MLRCISIKIVWCTALICLLAGCKGTGNIEMQMDLPLPAGDSITAPVSDKPHADDSASSPTTNIATLISGTDGNFYRNGFPTDLRRRADGSIDITDFPRHFHRLTTHYVNNIGTHTQGYPLISPVYMAFSGPLDPGALHYSDHDFANSFSPIQIVDVDPDSAEYGRHFPLHASMTGLPDSYRPRYLLQLLPTLGINLRPDTTYAAFVTDALPTPSGDSVQQASQLAAVLMPEAGETPLDDAVAQVYAPLRAYLEQQAIDPRSIIGATVWTTGDPGRALRTGSAFIAGMAEQLDTLPVSDIRLADEYPDYCIIKGTVTVPGFQSGTAPYRSSGGDIAWTADGLPVQTYVRHAPFVVTIPKNIVMPSGGFPLMSYIHGAGGSANQVYDRGPFQYFDPNEPPFYIGEKGAGPSQIAAERGWASSSLSGHLSMDHLGTSLGWLQGVYSYNMFNPVSTTNSDYQMTWEQIYFRRILQQLQLDPALCPAAQLASASTRIRLNTGLQVTMGQSQGNWINTLVAATDPQPYQGVIMSGMGGTWIKSYTSGAAYKLLMSAGVINLLPGEWLDDAHPFLMLTEWLMNGADAVVHAESLLRYPVKTPPHVIAFSGLNDYGSPETSQRTLMTAVNMDLAGDDMGWSDNTRLFPFLGIGGGRQLAYPVQDNIEVPGYGSRTSVVTRYRDTNIYSLYNGHEITYELPAIKHQYGCFLADLATGQAPYVNAGIAQGDPCTQ